MQQPCTKHAHDCSARGRAYLQSGPKPRRAADHAQVLSRDGWAIVDDTLTPRFSFAPPLWLGSLPWFAPPPNATRRADLYFFGCGTAFRACLGDFVALSGAVPLPPLATFGVPRGYRQIWRWALAWGFFDPRARGGHPRDASGQW